MKTKEELLNKMSKLESLNDQLLAELSYVDQLMRSVGFTDGLATIKATAIELIEREHNEFIESDFDNDEQGHQAI